MADDSAPALEIDRSLIGTLDVGTQNVSYVHLATTPTISARLSVSGTEYTYQQSVPILGHSAVMPDIVSEAIADGRSVLIAERDGRYFVYLA